ncbi:hypothetical protein SNOG_14744 [Parastagonospora nodorum SN15]|uniref:Uncharacterized protein n=2 Tax=Phaeosphaeria nodorum (strain SN15 / ATCC MYA-4574 / FGSC 10173) TaxID=321614 RepID=A0A7U2NPZ3_PHANO|nr:hypothetical protein SNOG_14744 [Parastagonospora nodorum SN15]EAT77936.1 hypothetical protein SNOG_14744 [Parastagonospora nodorum SN15]QRD06179.1 hypothetical protein JI435_147440 [Parastagonospora nodorum SN15]
MEQAVSDSATVMCTSEKVYLATCTNVDCKYSSHQYPGLGASFLIDRNIELGAMRWGDDKPKISLFARNLSVACIAIHLRPVRPLSGTLLWRPFVKLWEEAVEALHPDALSRLIVGADSSVTAAIALSRP